MVRLGYLSKYELKTKSFTASTVFLAKDAAISVQITCYFLFSKLNVQWYNTRVVGFLKRFCASGFR